MISHRLKFFLILSIILVPYVIFGQVKVELDEPGQDQFLNSQLWQFAKGTDYSSILPYIHKSQINSQRNLLNEVTLPTGWKISPAGKQVSLGRLPFNAIEYNGQLLILNSGYYYKQPQEISVVDVKTGELKRTLNVESLFPAACVGRDGKLYVSGGFDSKIYQFDENLNLSASITINGYTSGLDALNDSTIAVSCLTTTNSKGEYDRGKLAIVNTKQGKIVKEVEAGYFPYDVKVVQSRIFISVLGENKILVYDSNLKKIKEIRVGLSPASMTSGHNFLYVVNSNSDNISVINTGTLKVVRTYRLNEKGMKFGASPTSCAINGNKLYVTEATTNAVAVINLQSGKLMGYIPVGWYPTKVLFADGKMFVTSAKGIKSRRPNPDGPQPVKGKGGPDYVLTLLRGTLSIITQDSIKVKLAQWTGLVKNGSPLFTPARGFRIPIKHVFYIIRENRSYDQVLGDLGRGNGDSTLTIFGRSITPNAHKIAGDFVTLDNFYVDGEISVLGHSFTTSGYASPFLEWLGNVGYSSRYKGYPYGTVPAVFSPLYIWDALDLKGIDYRVYGEPYYLSTEAYKLIVKNFGDESELARAFYSHSMELSARVDRGKEFSDFARRYYGRANSISDAIELLSDNSFTSGLSRIFTGGLILQRALSASSKFKYDFAKFLYHYPFNYYTWDLNYSDLKRVKAWKEDFHRLENEKRVPAFEYIWLPNDHTGGTNTNYLNPYQLVAQNDAALGIILETISKSPIWKNSLVLVEEDDAQNGPDHVDATRTVALAAGPYVMRDKVVSERYDQLSMLRTIEIILGLNPLNLGDALAVPMFGIFTGKPDFRSYVPAAHSSLMAPSDVELMDAFERK
ncbi:MAG: bifunctional YncE family protein/alkaline phosphatase family protein [Candidatus Kryptoniota bacterium]